MRTKKRMAVPEEGVNSVSRKSFRAVMESYDPLPFEVADPSDPRFNIPMHHMLKNEDRFWKTLKVASEYFPEGDFAVADLGTYPGSLLRLLHRLLDPDRVRLFGVGLLTTDDFKQALAADCDAGILTVNLDPRNDQLKDKGYPTRIPVEDDSIDFIFGLEVIEHLVSPSHLISEAYRICRPGGHVLVTTPNVTRIGNVFKLLVGISNYDRLIAPDFLDPDDEWRPHFREYSLKEISDYLSHAGFRIERPMQLFMNDTRYNVRSFRQRLIDAAKRPFFVIPHLRENLLVVARKPKE